MKEGFYTFIGFVVATVTPTFVVGAITAATPNESNLETIVGLSPIILLISALVTGALAAFQ